SPGWCSSSRSRSRRARSTASRRSIPTTRVPASRLATGWCRRRDKDARLRALPPSPARLPRARAPNFGSLRKSPKAQGQNMKRTLSTGLVLMSLVGGVGCSKKEPTATQPPDVKAATVLQKDVPIYVEAIGQTRGSTEIEVRARVEGFLQSVDFKEG